jgi:hypothetical protein
MGTTSSLMGRTTRKDMVSQINGKLKRGKLDY